ncbi:RasGEF domain protein [Ceratobasidium sp. AG-Ba]|nr:RasGEF domain protein [Ceratobasidium sp. AG-Ba]QRW05276.1 RasGEF domain protein [Ceratobasidium sp. AG-Ba]
MDVDTPLGLLELAFRAVQDIEQRSQDVTVHCQQYMQLAKRSAEILNKLRDEQQTIDGSKLRDTINELQEVLFKVHKSIVEWANLNRFRSFMRQRKLATELDTFHQSLDNYVTKFQIMSPAELNRHQHTTNLYRQHDLNEAKEMLRVFVRNVDYLYVAAKMRDDVPTLMETIQIELKEERFGTEEHNVLRGGLNTLYNETGILPPLTNLTGQVVRLSEHPVAEGGTADIFEGHWVGDEKVMLKAICHVKSEFTVKRLWDEIHVWRRLQDRHVLRFYGMCYAAPTMYAVAPWADNGNLLVYVRRNPESDRVALLSEVAFGLKYLHTFHPTIVHGHLRAANVLVSATGEALLADFGFSKILAEESGPGVAPTSLRGARCMAPELFEFVDNKAYMISTASDVWSFGMLCLEVLTGQSPYLQCRVDGQVIAKLLDRKLPDRPEQTDDILQRGLSDDMWRVMNNCWAWNPAERPHIRTLADDVNLYMQHLRHGAVDDILQSASTPPVSELFQSTPLATVEKFPEETASIGSWFKPESVSLRFASLYPNSTDRFDSLDIDTFSTVGLRYEDAKINYDLDGRAVTGTLEGLIDHLLINSMSTQTNLEFQEAFLTTYRGFVRTGDLLPILIERFRIRVYGLITEGERVRLRKNMMAILNKWLEVQEIGLKDFGFLREMAAFVLSLPPGWSSGVEQRQLRWTIIQRLRKRAEPSAPPPANAGRRILLSDLYERSIAKELMRIEGDLFRNCLPRDCAACVNNIASELPQSLALFMKNNYKIVDWCQSVILLDSSDIEQRANAIVFLVRVAEECIKIRAFSTAHAIVAGLSTDFIKNLGYTWRLVDKRTRASLEDISTLVSNAESYKSALNSNLESPTVPILAIHLRELQRTYHGMETHVIVDQEPLVNFQKFEEVWKSVNSIMQYKSPQLNILRDPTTSAYLTYQLSKVDGGIELQNQFKIRSDELKTTEQRDFNSRRLGVKALFLDSLTRG